MPLIETLTTAEQRKMIAMAERLDAHFDQADFADHRPIRYGRLCTKVSDLSIRKERMALNHAELVALYCAVFDMPESAYFQGDDIIVGLAKRHGEEIAVTPNMIKASYTFLQWLGTNVGRSFVDGLQRAIDDHRALGASDQLAQITALQRMLQDYFKSPSRSEQKPFNVGLDETYEAAQHIAGIHYRNSLLALGTYLEFQVLGVKPETRNTFDYIMDEDIGQHGKFYADDDEQRVAMSLVAWLGTEEGASFLRFLDAQRVDI